MAYDNVGWHALVILAAAARDAHELGTPLTTVNLQASFECYRRDCGLSEDHMQAIARALDALGFKGIT